MLKQMKRGNSQSPDGVAPMQESAPMTQEEMGRQEDQLFPEINSLEDLMWLQMQADAHPEDALLQIRAKVEFDEMIKTDADLIELSKVISKMFQMETHTEDDPVQKIAPLG